MMEKNNLFIGSLVKLKDGIEVSNSRTQEFINNSIKEDWIWLVTSIDDEGIDCVIQPLCLDEECSHMTCLGGDLTVLYDEIEVIDIDRENLFNKLRGQYCNC